MPVGETVRRKDGRAMSDYLATYCIECDEPVDARMERRTENLTIRNERVSYAAEVAVCPHCHSVIGDSRLEEGNLNRAYETYRAEHGLVSAKDIADLRSDIGLSLREFSRFLGFGEQTAARYEKGALPDLLHSNTVKMASSPEGASLLLDLNREALSDESCEKVQSYIRKLQSGSKPSHFLIDLSSLLDEGSSPSRVNGYRRLDKKRVAAVVIRLAQQCDDLFKTKLQKGMFFCDFLSCERTGRSITGLQYAHADYGPIIDHYDSYIAYLVDRGYIEMIPCGWGEVVSPAGKAPQVLSPEEEALVDEVAMFVNSFFSANEISNYSHTLASWSSTNNGELINYNTNHGEITEAIERRMRTR